jgi:hypothetical protein
MVVAARTDRGFYDRSVRQASLDIPWKIIEKCLAITG